MLPRILRLEVGKSHHFVHKTFRSSFIRLILRGARSRVSDQPSPRVHPRSLIKRRIFLHLRSLFMTFFQGLICRQPSADVSVCTQMISLARKRCLKFTPSPLSITDGCIRSEFCLSWDWTWWRSVVSENSPGLPPSPEGHFAAGSLFLSLALRVAGKANVPD